MKNKKIIVIGAGIGGLSAAHWLQQKGYDVRVFEALDRAGGRIASIERDNGDKVDVGAEFFHSNYRHAFKLMEDFGLTDSLKNISGKTKLKFSDNSLIEFSSKALYIKGLGIKGNLKLGWFIFRNIILPRKMPTLFKIDEHKREWDEVKVSSLFLHPSDQKLRDVVASIGKSGSNCDAQWVSLYHLIQLMRVYLFTEFSVLKGGTASLSSAIADSLDVRYGSEVSQLLMDGDKVIGVELASGELAKADHVIVATTPLAATKIIPEALAKPRDFFQSIPQAPLAKPIFFLDRKISDELWSYINMPKDDRIFTMAVDESVKCPDMTSSGKSVIRAYACYPHSEKLLGLSEQEILDIALRDLEEMIPGISGWIEESQVFWHGQGGLAHYPVGAYGRIVDFKKQAEKLDGVSFVSDYFGTSLMEGAMQSAHEAVERITQLKYA